MSNGCEYVMRFEPSKAPVEYCGKMRNFGQMLCSEHYLNMIKVPEPLLPPE